MTTSTPRTTTSIRRLLAIALVAFLVLTTAPGRRAEASQGGVDVDTAALQAGICRLTGGTVTIDEHRTVGSGLLTMLVSCSGGLGGDWFCLTSFVGLEYSSCAWRTFQQPTGGAEDYTTTGGVVAEEPVDDVPTGADALVAPVLEEPVAEEPVVEEPVVEEPVVEDEPVVEEPSIPTPEPTPPADEEADGGPVDEPAGHDFSDEVADDEPVVDAPVDDPVVVDPLVDLALMDAEVAAEPAVDEDSFDGE